MLYFIRFRRKMSKLAVLILAIFFVIIRVKCFAEHQDDPDLIRKEDSDNLEQETEERSASPQPYSSASSKLSRPGLYPTQIRLVECYACVDCYKVLPNTTTKYCPFTNDPAKNNKCVVYTEKYKQMERPWYIRGCASERGSCSEITKAESANSRIVKLTQCSECEGDRCNVNGVARSLPNLIAAILFVVITPLMGKCALL
ncbi:uncharacterized protein LOC111354171 [Spodoptera litura]|uniref:Uncharacterized protein LOC111354171 n=1 Tax=Spodoptera litura TaxID=69820 RepID=A0A9J7IU19_SPOLT|nr:uncharacterized protein LOC111354171 [Spodoptera litura]